MLHLGPEDGLPRPEREIHLQVVAGHAVARMRNQPQVKVEIARRSAADARLSLAGQAQHGALARADRDVHVEAPAAGERDAAPAAPQQILEHHRQLGLDVAARDGDPHASLSPASGTLPEERGEEVAEPPRVLPLPGIRGAPLGPRAAA